MHCWLKNVRKWKYVYILLVHVKWKIDLLWEDEQCYFGKGWMDFVESCDVKAGDTVVFFRCSTSGEKTVNAAIFKQDDEVLQSSEGK